MSSKNIIQNISPHISETETERIVSGRTFIKHHDGERGGPPTEMLSEIRADEEKAARAALLTPMENPIALENRNLKETAEGELLVEPFNKTIWLEKNPPANGETIKFEINNFFKAVRPNVVGQASARNEFLYRVAVIPFIETPPPPVPLVQTRGQRTRVTGAMPQKPIVERFPLAFFTLSEFLKNHRPENGMDVTVLEVLSEPDRGCEREEWIQPPKPPTVEESIGKLVAALTAATKPATP